MEKADENDYWPDQRSIAIFLQAIDFLIRSALFTCQGHSIDHAVSDTDFSQDPGRAAVIRRQVVAMRRGCNGELEAVGSLSGEMATAHRPHSILMAWSLS